MVVVNSMPSVNVTRPHDYHYRSRSPYAGPEGCRGFQRAVGWQGSSGLTKVIDRVVVNCLLPVDRPSQRLHSASQVPHFVLKVQHDEGQDASQHLQQLAVGKVGEASVTVSRCGAARSSFRCS